MKTAADEQLRSALERTGLQDPRNEYRDLLLELRERNSDRFREAVQYYETRLIPAVAGGQTEPLEEWIEYGCLLARLLMSGTPVIIDPTGRRIPYSRPVPEDALVLHLPTSMGDPALALRIPSSPSPAQAAAHALLVKRRTSAGA
ncbi:MAG: hypothetical protein LBG44_01465 [Gemmatimonadota bacterium]|jgi:hypothetical protein|nr:hypothetical protein [Gemmatimonadota bacterium]